MKAKIPMIVLAAAATCAAVLVWSKKPINAVEAHSTLGVVTTASDKAIATTQVKVASPVDGKIREIRVEEGDRLERGQLIAILENADSTARVNRAEAELEQREARLGQVSGAAEVWKAKADVDQARIEVESARAGLLKTFIRSPINGVLLRKKAKPGESVSAANPNGWIAIIQAGSTR
jgi:multidrug efflux pump subunit AcrA (membrane-fusion protein)